MVQRLNDHYDALRNNRLQNNINQINNEEIDDSEDDYTEDTEDNIGSDKEEENSDDEEIIEVVSNNTQPLNTLQEQNKTIRKRGMNAEYEFIHKFTNTEEAIKAVKEEKVKV